MAFGLTAELQEVRFLEKKIGGEQRIIGECSAQTLILRALLLVEKGKDPFIVTDALMRNLHTFSYITDPVCDRIHDCGIIVDQVQDQIENIQVRYLVAPSTTFHEDLPVKYQVENARMCVQSALNKLMYETTLDLSEDV